MNPAMTIDVARFDEPTLIPGEIEAHWPDLMQQNWRLVSGHPALREARTPDVDGWHFVLMTEMQTRLQNFAIGFIEVVSRFHEDEHSVLFPALLHIETTWAHIWSWLRLGTLYVSGNVFQVFHNGEMQHSTTNTLRLTHGFFFQVVASAYTEADFMVIPRAKLNGWNRDMAISQGSAYGVVFRAGSNKFESSQTRLPYRDRDDAILQEWPDLTVYGRLTEHTHWRDDEGHLGSHLMMHISSKQIQMASMWLRSVPSLKAEAPRSMQLLYTDTVKFTLSYVLWIVHSVVPPRTMIVLYK